MAPLKPQVDTNWSSAVVGHPVIHMDTAEHDHIAIDIDDNNGHRGSTASSDDIPSCVVCTEPLEWVAVGPCGHRVVCSACAARIRSGPNPDHRCCVCRTYSPIVVVTNAAVAHSLFTFSESSMPVAAQDDDGRLYWYSVTMSAYFDDKKHYDQVTKQVVADHRTPPRPPPLRPDEDASSLHRLCVRMSWRGHVLALLIVGLVAALVGGSVGYLTTRDEVTSDRIGIVIGLAALYAALAAVVYGIIAVFHR
uniref:RING-type domain-containing protein n=1 Tax=Oryza punctata TaxID=4537 RepID=A0A0E0JK95_ORYPU